MICSKFLIEEIDLWFYSIIKKNWHKISSKIKYNNKDLLKELSEQMAGLAGSLGPVAPTREGRAELRAMPVLPVVFRREAAKPRFSALPLPALTSTKTGRTCSGSRAAARSRFGSKLGQPSGRILKTHI